MRKASGNEDFFITTAEESKQNYLEYIKNVDTSEVMNQLKEDADQSHSSGDLSKALLSSVSQSQNISGSGQGL